MAAYIDSMLMLLAGAYLTALGFGWVSSPSSNPEAGRQWMARYGTLLKWIGPLLVVIAVALSAARFLDMGG